MVFYKIKQVNILEGEAATSPQDIKNITAKNKGFKIMSASENIYNQIGGNKLKVMVGCINFVSSDKSLQFVFN